MLTFQRNHIMIAAKRTKYIYFLAHLSKREKTQRNCLSLPIKHSIKWRSL
jgi:hypothetical protein